MKKKALLAAVLLAALSVTPGCSKLSGDNGSGNGFPPEKGEGYGETDGIPWVDLGLESGIKWARVNVGAENPWDYGDYFAWGETEPKDTYSEKNYKYITDSKRVATKYNLNPKSSYCDKKGSLEPEDDAAPVRMGG